MTQIVLALCAGLLIEAFFQLVKYRDSLNTEGPKGVTMYGNLVDAGNYMSVSQYLSGGHRKWFHYFLFRLLPPFVVFMLLAGVLEKYFNAEQHVFYSVLIAAIFSLLFRDMTQIFRTKSISERLLHAVNILLVASESAAVAYIASVFDLSFLAPSISGLVDNVWSSLLVALLVLFYFKATNMNSRQQASNDQETAIDNYIVRSYSEMRNKFSSIIDSSCRKNTCSKQLLYAVLIYENMNRPVWLRKIENLLVRLPKLHLTVGIAQISSNRSLTDEESIKEASKILANSTYADSGVGDGFSDISQLENILEEYNSDKQYAASISMIITRLRFYAQDIFGEIE